MNSHTIPNPHEQIICSLLNHFPRFAEEEGDHYSVKRSDLIQTLAQEQSIAPEVAENTIHLCELLLNTLSTLNPDKLHQGEWCFVSFPAQLMASSILTAMSDPNSRFFKHDFWNTQSISNDKKDQQRKILRAVELRRNHASDSALPIRYIHVAWGLIKENDRILLYQREDTQKRHEPDAGDYGLIGGRVNQTDFPFCQQDIKTRLQHLQSPDRELIKPALINTLKRELQEETGLHDQQHYTYTPWCELHPYRQVQGAAPNHALTEYFITVYAIKLTLAGFCSLHQKIKDDKRLAWFSVDEIVTGQTKDGAKRAYLNALHAHFPTDLQAQLMQLPDSFAADYPNPNKPSKDYRILLSNDSIKTGIAGKRFAVPITLQPNQQLLLLGLAAHLLGFEFNPLASGITLHPHGWIEVIENDLRTSLIELTDQLKSCTQIAIKAHQERWFRLEVDPKTLCFADSYFRCSLKYKDLKECIKSKIPITIARNAIATPLGTIEPCSQELQVSLELGSNLCKLHTNTYTSDNDKARKIRDNYRKDPLHKSLLAMGMMGLIRQEAGVFKICGDFRVE
jgi:8-oxo-dGTP pyrophosphatase MutT (NUDIX family)